MPLPTKLPSNIEAEKKVLAAAMTNRVSRVEIVASCTESDFFSPSNRTIFKAICDLDAKGIGADCVSVIDGLRSSGKLAAVGGEAYVIELISDDFAQASFEHYVDILRRDTARRNVIAATAEVTSLTNNPPIDTAEYISALIFSVLKTSMMHPYTIDVDTIRCGPRGDPTFRWRPQGCPRFLTCPARAAASRDRRMT